MSETRPSPGLHARLRTILQACRDRGAAGVEYGILIGAVAVVISAAVAIFGGQLATMFTGATYALRGETAPEPARMVLTYDTTAPGCADSTIALPVGGAVDGTVDWGDGTTGVPLAQGVSHTYTTTSAPHPHR